MKYSLARDNQRPSNDKNNYLVQKPLWRLDEIILSPDISASIEELVTYQQHKTTLLDTWGFSHFMKAGGGLSVNFFGPPGTGKSITADAVAAHLSMNIIRINYADLESKYVGETAANLRTVFSNATNNNCLLFFDEADNVLSHRLSNLSQAADHSINIAKSTLLTLLDEFTGVAVFATNLFGNYDDAFLRRILFHIEFPLPNLEMRVRLWEMHLHANVPKNVSYDRLGELSDGFSGGDIRNVSIKMALKILAGRFKAIDDDIAKAEIDRHRTISKYIAARTSTVRVITETIDQSA